MKPKIFILVLLIQFSIHLIGKESLSKYYSSKANITIDDTIKIDSIVRGIDKNLKKYKRIKKSIYGKRLEVDASIIWKLADATAYYYFQDNDLIKIKIKFIGSQSDMFSSYYCHNGKLIYVFKEEFLYNLPKYNNGKVEKTIENTYYVDKDKIVKHYFEGGAIRYNIVDGVDITMKAQEIMNDFEIYLGYRK